MSETVEAETVEDVDRIVAERSRKVINKPARRHIYAVIIDCAEKDDEMAMLAARTALEAFTNPDGKQRNVNCQVVVPISDEEERRLPKVMLR